MRRPVPGTRYVPVLGLVDEKQVGLIPGTRYWQPYQSV